MTDQYEFKISGRLVRLGNAVSRYRNRKTAFLDLTSTQSEAVRYIIKNHEKDLTEQDLMDYLNLSQSTVSGVVRRLCEKGFVAREKDPSDSRRTLLRLSEAGYALDEQLWEVGRETEQLLVESMSPGEVTQLNRLLELALDNMTRQRYQS